MTFGEKLKKVRLALNMSQKELSNKAGISERSLYTYEQTGIFPRSGNIQKLAEALNVSVGYLLDEEETDTAKNIDQNMLFSGVKSEHGYDGALETAQILAKISDLFSSDALSRESKDMFFQIVMQIYLDSKEKDNSQYSQNGRIRRRKKQP